MNLIERITSELSNGSAETREISRALNVPKKEVNQVLYGNIQRFEQTSKIPPVWRLKGLPVPKAQIHTTIYVDMETMPCQIGPKDGIGIMYIGVRGQVSSIDITWNICSQLSSMPKDMKICIVSSNPVFKRLVSILTDLGYNASITENIESDD